MITESSCSIFAKTLVKIAMAPAISCLWGSSFDSFSSSKLFEIASKSSRNVNCLSSQKTNWCK